MPAAHQLTGPDAEHGEGPIWWPGWDGLRWVDMIAGDVLHLDDATGVIQRWHVDKVAAIIRPRTAGGVVVVGERRVLLAAEAGGVATEMSPPAVVFDDPNIRFNEGACDPAGRLLAGTMAYAQTPGAGRVYRLEAAGSLEVVMTDIGISNGLCWTAAGDRAYYVDSATRRVDVLDSDEAGNLSGRRPFARIDAGDAVPDGLTVDTEGGVWVALYQGAAVHHYDAGGRLQDVITVAAQKVTACTFGGPALDQLFITTSRQGGADSPAAGALFTFSAGVIGQLPRPFAG